MLKVNLETIKSVDLSGRGGKEELVTSLFENRLRRSSKSLYDLVDLDTGERYELKKQKDLQWLDPSKYYQLTLDEESIVMIFICYSSRGVDLIYTCLLGDLVREEYSNEVIEACRKVRAVDASIQTKKGLKTRSFFERNPQICKLVYKQTP